MPPARPVVAGVATAGAPNVSWLLDARANERPTQPFLIWEPFDGPTRVWTYGELADAVTRVSGALRARGITTGDHVVIHLDNCAEYVVAWFACARLGAVAVCTNTRSALDELRYYAAHSGAVAAITQSSLSELVNAAMPEARFLAVTDDRGRDGFHRLQEGDPVDPVDLDEHSPASIQYTSGTTGRPKGVVWTQANLWWAAAVNASHEDLRETDIQYTYLPLFHTNAQGYSILASLWAGSTVVLQPKFSASRYWDVSVKHRCTFGSHIYFALRVLMERDDAPAAHSYRLWGTGMCDHPASARFGVPTIGWWGMTETVSHPIVGSVGGPNRPRSMGRVAPEYEIAVRRDDGTPVEAEETGELHIRGVRGVSMFAGYLNDPDATAAAFDAAGWFATGDLVTVHADGAIDFADRAKDMLRVGSENVAASEIERVVAPVAGVKEVAVIGVPDRFLGEVPVAFVVVTDRRPTIAAEILDACSAQLADFKVPREVRIVDDLPRATLEKVAKHELRRIASEEAAGQAADQIG